MKKVLILFALLLNLMFLPVSAETTHGFQDFAWGTERELIAQTKELVLKDDFPTPFTNIVAYQITDPNQAQDTYLMFSQDRLVGYKHIYKNETEWRGLLDHLKRGKYIVAAPPELILFLDQNMIFCDDRQQSAIVVDAAFVFNDLPAGSLSYKFEDVDKNASYALILQSDHASLMEDLKNSPWPAWGSDRNDLKNKFLFMKPLEEEDSDVRVYVAFNHYMSLPDSKHVYPIAMAFKNENLIFTQINFSNKEDLKQYLKSLPQQSAGYTKKDGSVLFSQTSERSEFFDYYVSDHTVVAFPKSLASSPGDFSDKPALWKITYYDRNFFFEIAHPRDLSFPKEEMPMKLV